MTEMRISKRQQIYAVFTVLPLLVLVFFIFYCKIEVPSIDEGVLVLPLLEKSFLGTLTFQDLFSQHCEHRPFFPRLLIILFARITGWNKTAELMVSLFCAIGIFLLLKRQIKLTLIAANRLDQAIIVPLVSLIVFSLGQNDNFWMGMNLMLMMGFLCAVTGLLVLSNSFNWRQFFMALGLGVVAVYSYATGLTYWLIGTFPLLVSPMGARKRKLCIGIWLVVGGAVFLLYFYNFKRPAYTGFPVAKTIVLFSQPIEYIKFVSKYLGSAIAYFSTKLAYLYVLLAFCGIPIAIRFLIQKKALSFVLFIPYITLSLFSLGSALLTGMSRAGWCSIMAFSSRYLTFSSLLWISVSVLVYLILVTSVRYSFVHKVSIALLVAITCSIFFSSIRGGIEMVENRRALSGLKEEILRGTRIGHYSAYGRDACLPERELDILKKYRLSIFRIVR